MKAISLWQPWATAIACGAKSIETRGWETHYTGRILIHAAKRHVKRDLAHCWTFQQWRDALKGNECMPFGALIAVAELIGCYNVESLKLTEQERFFGDYSPGRFGWILYDVRRFQEPIAYTGRQGLFNVPDELVADAIKHAVQTETTTNA